MESDGAKVRPIGKWPTRRATCAKFVTQRRSMRSSTTAATCVLALNVPSRSMLVLFAARTFGMWSGCTGLKTEFAAANWTLIPGCIFTGRTGRSWNGARRLDISESPFGLSLLHSLYSSWLFASTWRVDDIFHEGKTGARGLELLRSAHITRNTFRVSPYVTVVEVDVPLTRVTRRDEMRVGHRKKRPHNTECAWSICSCRRDSQRGNHQRGTLDESFAVLQLRLRTRTRPYVAAP